jgi:hypothetical protein
LNGAGKKTVVNCILVVVPLTEIKRRQKYCADQTMAIKMRSIVLLFPVETMSEAVLEALMLLSGNTLAAEIKRFISL